MEMHIRRFRFANVTLAFATVVVAGLALTQTSAAVRPQATTPASAAMPSMGPQMGSMGTDEMRTMMARRQQMMSDMKVEEKALDDLVARMNAAKGTDKVDAIAAVVTELASQRRRMSARMMDMQGDMMRHMDMMRQMTEHTK